MPEAIRYGIRYDEFMRMTPKVFAVYRKEYDEKVQREADIIDYTAWLNGIYVRSAIASCFDKNSKYPEKPFNEEQKEETFRNENPDKAAAFDFEMYVNAFNAIRKSGE